MTSSFATVENLIVHERYGNLIPFTPKPDFGYAARLKVVDWMCDISMMFKLRNETFLHAVSMFDACSVFVTLSSNNAQLYCIACMFIASKKYEIYAPEVSDFVYVADKLEQTITEELILQTEIEILKYFGYNIELANVMEYLRLASSRNDVDIKVHNIAKLICTFYTIGKKVDFLPSVLATIALRIAQQFVCGESKVTDTYNVPEFVINNILHVIAKVVLKFVKSSSEVSKKQQERHITKNGLSCDKFITTLQRFVDGGRNKEHSSNFDAYLTDNYRNLIETPYINKKDYKRIASLGSGTYGEVHKVEIINTIDARCDYYAFKRTSRDFCDDQGLAASFIREVSILLSLKHKNIVTLTHIASNSSGYLMELMDSDLKTYCSKNVLVISNVNFQKKVTMDLLTGLEYMHSHGVLNRDIKPQNILVKGMWNEEYPDRLQIKYCDFGLARGKGIAIDSVIATTEVCTLFYRPMELLLGTKNTYGPHIDVWSVGCTIFEACTGKPLFVGDCCIDQIHKIAKILGTPLKSDYLGWISTNRFLTKYQNGINSRIILIVQLTKT